MARRSKKDRFKSKDGRLEVDLTPMIDVVFNLLIFFLCLPFRSAEGELDAFLPQDVGLFQDTVKLEDLEKVIIGGPLSRGNRHCLDLVREIAAKNIVITEGAEEWCQNNIVCTGFADEEIEIAGAVAAFISQYSK